jgi:hypothetical protein
MNLLKVTPENSIFLASAAEKEAWCGLLKLFPLQSSVVQPRDKTNAADREMLEEALSTQRQANRKEIETMLHGKGGFTPHGASFKLSLKPSQIETMLQILNDLRVGSWHALGCPDQLSRRHIRPSDPEFRHVWAMELAGHFQMALLEACAARE